MSEESGVKEEAMKGFEKAASAILGLLALSEQRAKELFDELAEKGAQAKTERSSVFARVIAQAEEEKASILKKAGEQFSSALARLNLATKDDIARLEKLINEKLG